MVDVTKVREKHRFDEENLRTYLTRNVEEFGRGDGKLSVLQFSFGQSNPTFYLTKDDTEAVLRKKPPGRLLPGAHRVDREFRVMSALRSQAFPVAKPLLYCKDESIIGTEFYIMEYVKGPIFRDPSLPDKSPSERKAMYGAMVSTLAKLHSVDWRTMGLADFGRHGNYLKRQISTWSKQYKASATRNLSAVNDLISWLWSNVPEDSGETVIVHGDYRIDNIVFHPSKPQVVAVLDWELCTLGHPILDLAYHCVPYHSTPQLAQILPTFSLDKLPEGIPSENEYVAHYCQARQINFSLQDWNFFLALSYFRLAGIAQGVYARYLQGNASAENAKLFGSVVEHLAEIGLKLAKGSLDVTIPKEISVFQPSARVKNLHAKMKKFMKDHIYPAEKIYLEHASKPDVQWTIPPIMEQLKAKARSAGLWNLFLPSESGLTQLDYALLAELTGRSPIAPEIFNCSAPDTGNMEVLHLYGSPEQKKRWLEPLLRGDIRSAFCMTEPDVASSDATNMQCTITRDGNNYVINGRKWWSSGAGDPRCKVAIVMGKSADHASSRHLRHSMILVPFDTPGIVKVRPLTVFGYNDAPHGHLEVRFENVRVPVSNMILGEGRGFEIAQGRLGPGRIHHCMRLIGLAERSLEMLCQRSLERVAFSQPLAKKGMVQEQIALSRIEIEQARLLVLKAAHTIDTLGNKAARKEVAMAKVAAPRMACSVVDRAIQVHGGMGVSQDSLLPKFYTIARSVRIADGPDEVHLESIAKQELKLQSRL